MCAQKQSENRAKTEQNIAGRTFARDKLTDRELSRVDTLSSCKP